MNEEQIERARMMIGLHIAAHPELDQNIACVAAIGVSHAVEALTSPSGDSFFERRGRFLMFAMRAAEELAEDHAADGEPSCHAAYVRAVSDGFTWCMAHKAEVML